MPILYDERKKERRKKEKKKTSNYVNERTPFLFFSSFFTLVSDVFEKKVQRNRILGGMLKQRKMKAKLSKVISLIRYSYTHKILTKTAPCFSARINELFLIT